MNPGELVKVVGGPYASAKLVTLERQCETRALPLVLEAARRLIRNHSDAAPEAIRECEDYLAWIARSGVDVWLVRLEPQSMDPKHPDASLALIAASDLAALPPVVLNIT